MAAWALSSIPFSSRPVITSLPFPATTATSHARSSPPPLEVTERPLVRPISSCSSFLPTRNLGTPRYFGTSLPTTSIGFSLPWGGSGFLPAVFALHNARDREDSIDPMGVLKGEGKAPGGLGG